MFRNNSHFISFSKLIMQSIIKTNETFLIKYSNFYFNICKNYPVENNIYYKKNKK